MRLISIRTPNGEGKQVAEIAFKVGIKEVAISTAQTHRLGENPILQDVVNIETATPLAKVFIDALMETPFYDPKLYSFTIRHPESIFSSNPPEVETHPVIRPTTDVYQELYQFSKVTLSLAGRVFISAVLLSYGMIEDFMPLIISGLLFLPYHHHMLGISLGTVIKEWSFLRQALAALVTSTLLIFTAGMLVALLCEPPIQFELKGSPLVGAALSAIIGVAAALASLDDAGRTELIGLAATAHISVDPAWIGLQVGFGDINSPQTMEHVSTFLLNITLLILAAILTYAVAGTHGKGINQFIKGSRQREKS